MAEALGVASSNAETRLTATVCKVDNNQAVSGGGLYGVGTLTNLSLAACILHSNRATLGAALLLIWGQK